MTPDSSDDPRWAHVDELLERALELPRRERSAFLDAEVDDPELRATVDAILAEEERTGFLDPGGVRARPTFRNLEDTLERRAPRLERVGPYRLLGEIGRGGMARVFEAERTAGGFDQRVAIKLIRSGGFGEAARQRFAQERQILAGLSHPSIARLLDGGETEDNPWFAMELVDGEPIESYCRAHGLDLAARLRLFMKVAEAVAYAHRNLVVHRDLKSSNVLVTRSGEVKLLDFGIAKLVEPEAAGLTAADQRPMTPEFASPEQVLAKPVTTASDVYQLGHLLYRLITDRSPYQGETTTSSSFHHAILTEAPMPPSRAACPSGGEENEAVVGSERAGVPWAADLRGDLDAIVLMALRKEPERRYATVDRLLDDLKAYFDGRPVQARPDSLGYRLRKLVARHRAAVIVAVTAALLLAAGGVLFTARLARERDRAVTEARKSRAVADFLAETFGASDPSVAEGEVPTARDLLDRGAARISTELAGEPELEAALLETMGRAYRSLGLYDPAEKLLRDSLERRRQHLGRQHPESLRAAEGLGSVLWRQGRFDEASELHQGALDIARTTLGTDHPQTLSLANHLGMDWWRLGRLAEAEELLESTAAGMETALGSDHPETLAARSNLAGVQVGQGRFAEAADQYGRVLESRRQSRGPDHDLTLVALYNLGIVYRELGRFEEAGPLLEEAARRRRRVFGDDHPSTLGSVSGLASFYAAAGRLDDAVRLHTETLEARRRVLGETHRDTLSSVQNLAATHYLAGDADAAVPLLRENVELRRRALGDEHLATLRAAKVLGQILLEFGRFAEAEEIYRRTLPVYVRTQSPDHRVAIEMGRDLGRLACRGDEAARGLTLVDEALGRARAHFAGDALLVGTSLVERGRCLTELDRYAAAETALVEGHAVLEDARLPDPRHEVRARRGLVELYEAWGKPERARFWREPGADPR